MIFFTTFVTLIRRQQAGPERRLGSAAQVKGNTLRLPIGTDVQIGDYVEQCLPNDELQRMCVIDVIHPYMSSTRAVDDHIEVTCAPSRRVTVKVPAPALHPTMSAALALVEEGRMSEAVLEAVRVIEEQVRLLTASQDSGHALMETVFGAQPPQLDITTVTGPAAEAEREGFRLLFTGAVLGLGDAHGTGKAVPATVDETWEYLAVASMLMRRLDRAKDR
jgi:uncharacterized protein (TIGR02391 family)